MLPLVLETSVREVGKRLASSEPCVWVREEPTQDDLDHILKEGTETSRFDPLGLRYQMLEDLRKGRARLLCRRCSLAKVLLIVYPDAVASFPWELWGRVFQAFGKPPLGHSAPFWRVTVFANPTPRQFPPKGQEPGPGHVNGGYAIPRDPMSIVIYRLEECTRVLVHELLHAAGTDTLTHPEALRESLTESWAEIFLIAIQANGHPRKAATLWKKQANWIQNQESLLTQEHGVKGVENYVARYTTERRGILEGFGFKVPSGSSGYSAPKGPKARQELNNSLQFTHPSLNKS